MAEVFFLQHNYQASANAYRDSLNGDGEPRWTEVWSHIQLGKIFDITGQRERATAEYRQAIQTNDNTQGALDEARRYLQKAYEQPKEFGRRSSRIFPSTMKLMTPKRKHRAEVSYLQTTGHTSRRGLPFLQRTLPDYRSGQMGQRDSTSSLRRCRTPTTRKYHIFATVLMRNDITGMADGHAEAPAPVWATLVATFFGAGRMRPGPGTWGSAAAALIWFGLARWIPVAWQAEVLAALAAVAVGLGIPAATRVARASAGGRPTVCGDRRSCRTMDHPAIRSGGVENGAGGLYTF